MESWVRVPLNCNSVSPTSDITFIDTTKADYDADHDRSKASFNPHRLNPKSGRPMSPCYQCVLFYNPSLDIGDEDGVHALYPSLEMWVRGDRIFFFRAYYG
jgi:hypothetical protein